MVLKRAVRDVCLLISSTGLVQVTAQQLPPGRPALNETALFQELPVVEAASLHAQTLEEAPANVTVISAADIRKYGYRTLGEALASVRGFDITYDRIYHFVGVHGFSLPGDYNTRVLVMLNGHPLTENIFSSNNFFGQDFGLDMDLVQRIEIVRGPSSALYGSNAILTTINVVTKSPVDQPTARVSTETGSFGEKKVSASAAGYLGRGANLLISASLFNNTGQTLYFPEFDAPASNNGVARGVDGERGYHTFANLVWRDWNVLAYFNSREKQPPVNWESNALFAHRGAVVQDRRNFLSVTHTNTVGATGQLRVRLSYDQYRYDDRFFYPQEPEQQELQTRDFRNIALGDWMTANITYSVPTGKLGQLTVGAQGNVEFRNLQRNITVSPAYDEQLHISRPDRGFALFAQQEVNLSRRWTAVLGVRFDDTINLVHFISPRVALVRQQTKNTVYKFVYGHPFRNPSTFEEYYSDGLSYLPSGGLHPESAHTFEISAEHKLRPNLTAIINAYHYRIDDVIQTVYLPNDYQQFRNGTRLQSNGLELEMNGHLFRRLEGAASVALQDTTAGHGQPLANSAAVIAKGRFAVPIVMNKLYASSSVRYLSARRTHDDNSVSPVMLIDTTVTWTGHRHSGFDVQFGIRNLMNCIYWDPVAVAVGQMQQDGRSIFLKLSWEFGG